MTLYQNLVSEGNLIDTSRLIAFLDDKKIIKESCALNNPDGSLLSFLLLLSYTQNNDFEESYANHSLEVDGVGIDDVITSLRSSRAKTLEKMIKLELLKRVAWVKYFFIKRVRLSLARKESSATQPGSFTNILKRENIKDMHEYERFLSDYFYYNYRDIDATTGDEALFMT